MRLRRIFDRLLKRNRDPQARAAEIKAKYEAKRKGQGMFTPAQEELMDELGLKPGSERKSKKFKRKSDPMSLAVDEAERLKRIHSTRRGRK